MLILTTSVIWERFILLVLIVRKVAFANGQAGIKSE